MKIKYEFVTGEILEVEVPDDVAKISIEIDRDIQNSNRKERRRHKSIEWMTQQGVQLSENTDIEIKLIENQILEELRNALKRLLPEQQELIFKVFFCEKSIAEIAREEGVTIPAIYSRLNRIYRKLKEIAF